MASQRRLSMKLSQLQCSHCDYQSSVADEDFGYRTNTLTMICRTCSSLVEVVIRADSPEQDRLLKRCPRCASAKVSPWNPISMPCPKCGTSMQKAAKVAL